MQRNQNVSDQLTTVGEAEEESEAKLSSAAPHVSLAEEVAEVGGGAESTVCRCECLRAKFKGHRPLLQTVLHCTQAGNVAADGSGETNALIVHYI